MNERMLRMELGVVVERRKVDHPWQTHELLPVAVIPGAPPVDAPRELAHGDGWVRYHAATLTLELHRKETEAYKTNLSSDPPQIYVVLRSEDDDEAEADPTCFLVTASAYEAQDYLDTGEDIVEGVAMPDGVLAWVENFVARHHVDVPFKKRKRTPHDPDNTAFSRPPPEMRRRNGKADGHD